MNLNRTTGLFGDVDADRANGNNRLHAHDRAVHDWYRFVLSFPPHLVRDYLTRFEVSAAQLVLDPFCGTGTTLVECKKMGVPSVGLEASPMAWFASRVKTCWEVDPARLRSDARRIAERAGAELEKGGVQDAPLLRSRVAALSPLRSLPEDGRKLLLKDSISPFPLHKILVLLELIDRQPDERIRDCLRLALARTAVETASNLHFGPEVGVGTIKQDAPAIRPWLALVERMADDLAELRSRQRVASSVLRSDSREIPEEIEPGSVGAVITSPPYPNEKDYSRTTRLESILLGFIKNKSELRQFKRDLVRSNTRNVYKGDDDHKWIASHPIVESLADEIESRRIAMGKTSGFERMYANVTRLYFGGMARHLGSLRRALAPGACLAYVVGDQASYLRVMIRTGQILGEIAQGLGYEVVGLDLFRTRMATATRQQLREEVLVMRWPGTRPPGRAGSSS